jgi:hypothetical protein
MNALGPTAPAALALSLAYAMIGAGVVKKRLAWRLRRCGACGRPMPFCTCYWR